jgi:peptidoglycan-associated lipoprotein
MEFTSRRNLKMYKHSFSRFALLGLLAVTVIGIGCGPKRLPSTPPPAASAPTTTAPPARPTVTLQASSTFIQRGESTTLTWSSTNATTLTLNPGVGTVAPEGSSKVSPTDSTTYSITATGPGGTADQSIRVTVSASAPPVAVESTTSETPDAAFLRNMHDAYFDYNEAALRADAKDALSQSAVFLRTHADINIIVEGYCDERGTTEYNLGLGQKRADAVKQFLESLGIPAARVSTTSFGKEKPFCSEHTESCWQQNRRGHFVKAH